MACNDYTAWEEGALEHFLILGREIATTAVTFRATYLSAHLRLAEGELVAFSYEDGAVWVTGRGFEVELSALPRW